MGKRKEYRLMSMVQGSWICILSTLSFFLRKMTGTGAGYVMQLNPFDSVLMDCFYPIHDRKNCAGSTPASAANSGVTRSCVSAAFGNWTDCIGSPRSWSVQ